MLDVMPDWITSATVPTCGLPTKLCVNTTADQHDQRIQIMQVSEVISTEPEAQHPFDFGRASCIRNTVWPAPVLAQCASTINMKIAGHFRATEFNLS